MDGWMDEAEPALEQRRGKRDSGQQSGYELARCADLTFDPERMHAGTS
jgi:hypothetical protein